MIDKSYYVYELFYGKGKGKSFYIGKGKGIRAQEHLRGKSSLAEFISELIMKGETVSLRIIQKGLSSEAALEMEALEIQRRYKCDLLNKRKRLPYSVPSYYVPVAKRLNEAGQSRTVNVRFKEPMFREMRRYADAEERSATEFVRFAVRRYIEQLEGESNTNAKSTVLN